MLVKSLNFKAVFLPIEIITNSKIAIRETKATHISIDQLANGVYLLYILNKDNSLIKVEKVVIDKK